MAEMTAPVGMRLSEALAPRPVAVAPRGQWDEIGQGLMSAFVANIQKQMGGENATPGDELDRMMKYMMVMKMMKEMREEPGETADKGMWTFLAAALKGNSEQLTQLMALLMKNQAGPDPATAAQTAQDQFLKMLEVARSLQPQNESNDLLKQIGMQSLQSAMTQDPFETALATMEKVKKLQGDPDQQAVVNLEMWKARKAIEIEEKKLEKEDAREQRQMESRSQLMNGFAQMVQGGAIGGAMKPDDATPGLVRMKCHACQHEWPTPPVDHGYCPACGVAFRREGAPVPPPPPTPSGPPAGLAPTPALQDDGWGSVGALGFDPLQ